MENNIVEIFKQSVPQIQELVKSKFQEHRTFFNSYPVSAGSYEFQKMIEEISHCACSNYMRTLLNYNTVDKAAYLLPEPKEFGYAPYEDRVNFAEATLRFIQSVYHIWYVYTLIGDRKAKDPEEFIYYSAPNLLDVMVDRFNEQFKNCKMGSIDVTSWFAMPSSPVEEKSYGGVKTIKKLIIEIEFGEEQKIQVWHNTGYVMPGYGNLEYRLFVKGEQENLVFRGSYPSSLLHFDTETMTYTGLKDDIIEYLQSIHIE